MSILYFVNDDAQSASQCADKFKWPFWNDKQ